MDDEMKKIYSFKPKINTKSQILDKQRTEKCEIPRYEILHELNYVLRERDNEMQEYYKKLGEEKFMEKEGKECTFKPNIN